MRCLIVEDDAYKVEGVTEILKSIAPKCELTLSKSVQSAVLNINSHQYDLIILDMSLPSHDAEKGASLGIPRLSGGVEVIFELEDMQKSSSVIILTQYPEIEMSGKLVPLINVQAFVNENYSYNLLACIYFDIETNDWKQALTEGISKLENINS